MSPGVASFVVLGEALIDLFADKGVPLRSAEALHVAPGGAPANVAVALARLGAEVAFIGKVGADAFGERLTGLLAAEGVDTTHLLADQQAPTMLAVVAAPSPSEQDFVLYAGASALLTPSELPEATLASADAFSYGSVTLSTGSRDAALQAAHRVREAGGQVIFDVNLRPSLWESLDLARLQIENALATATVLKLNEAELAFLTGSSDPVQGARALLEAGPELCCVSLGVDGAAFATKAVSGHIPTFPVEVEDTTGSGDAFLAGLAYQLLSQEAEVRLTEANLRRAVTFANACGALAATRLGAMSALPTRDEVDDLVMK
jgi:sugar/nucleoside kinase (ribokinase family)